MTTKSKNGNMYAESAINIPLNNISLSENGKKSDLP